WLTSGLFRLVSEFAVDHLGGVRYLLTGGDVVFPEHVRRVLNRHRTLVVVNGYGPTENTTFTSVQSVANVMDVESPLPLGRPVANTRVPILARRGRVGPRGAVGELYAAGDGLACGYFADEEQTKNAFGQLSPDVPARLYRTGDLARLDTQGRLRF